MLINSYRFATAATDPNFANVSLLLHGNGTNGQQTPITDNSPSPKTVTAVGNAQISTAIADPFGNSTRGVLAFDGTGDYLTSPSNAAFNYLTGDFTTEGWFRGNDVALLQTVYSQITFDGSTASDGATLRINNSKIAFVYYNNSSGPLFIIGDVTTLSSNSWYHFAVSRQGNVFRLFLNGTLEGTATDTISLASGKILSIGRWEGFTTRDFNGYIDEIRITKGIARYTANFTPPTAPFPDS